MRERMGRIARRIIWVAVIGVPVAVMLCLAALLLVFVLLDDTDPDGARVRLLYETDHQALLDACRELSRRVAAGEIKPSDYLIGRHPDSRTLTFPQIILDLKPSFVSIGTSGGVTIAMVGHSDPLGVTTYSPEDREQHHIAGKKLVEGLWYYDLKYQEHRGDWERHLEDLRPKAKPP